MKCYNRIYISNKNKKGMRIPKVMSKFHLTKLYYQVSNTRQPITKSNNL